MKKKSYLSVLLSSLIFLLFGATSIFSQHHYGNWVHKGATDTTTVRCWNDSLTFIMFPPGSMMGMMFPDSLYCRIDKMPLDSLEHPHDSTFIGWYRIGIGRDSIHNDMMDDSMMGGNHTMQFMNSLQFQLHWDSLFTDSIHRSWMLNGVCGWNGTQWIYLSNDAINDAMIFIETAEIYSAIAFVGISSEVTGIATSAIELKQPKLEQNYPNPFNPTTQISYTIPTTADVTIKIYDLLGCEISTLCNERKSAGEYSVVWNADGIPSGIYFYRIVAGNFIETNKMVLMK